MEDSQSRFIDSASKKRDSSKSTTPFRGCIRSKRGKRREVVANKNERSNAPKEKPGIENELPEEKTRWPSKKGNSELEKNKTVTSISKGGGNE